jgi:DNA-directed RNA polymerase alpha subunit
MRTPNKPRSFEQVQKANMTVERIYERLGMPVYKNRDVLPWANRGFSKRVIEVLIDRGIDAPERLLFVTEEELRKIPKIGKAGLAEIFQYRARFLPSEAERL